MSRHRDRSSPTRVRIEILRRSRGRIHRGQISTTGHKRCHPTEAPKVRLGRKATKHVRTLFDRLWLQAEVGPRRFYVRSWVNSGRGDVRYGPKSQANQNSTSSHLAECNITRFTSHSDCKVFRAALSRSGVQIVPTSITEAMTRSPARRLRPAILHWSAYWTLSASV